MFVWFRLALLNKVRYPTSIFFRVTKVLNVVVRYRYVYNPETAFHMMRILIRLFT
jgi:hypothetical protein